MGGRFGRSWERVCEGGRNGWWEEDVGAISMDLKIRSGNNYVVEMLIKWVN